ncbi:hypothetical protein PVAP13_6KG302824 [Panicum virgatum]|uniref:Uncharacterized protein n=1 Tax=Panicum virgatum TaxID=38727 RepID=A0A8T0RID7_PANVG|nr:hypothetical protein PVAP13_6KG302824 [Panicum virgatum]
MESYLLLLLLLSLQPTVKDTNNSPDYDWSFVK